MLEMQDLPKTAGHTFDDLFRINFQFPERPIIHNDEWVLTLLEMLVAGHELVVDERPSL